MKHEMVLRLPAGQKGSYEEICKMLVAQNPDVFIPVAKDPFEEIPEFLMRYKGRLQVQLDWSGAELNDALPPWESAAMRQWGMDLKHFFGSVFFYLKREPDQMRLWGACMTLPEYVDSDADCRIRSLRLNYDTTRFTEPHAQKMDQLEEEMALAKTEEERFNILRRVGPADTSWLSYRQLATEMTDILPFLFRIGYSLNEVIAECDQLNADLGLGIPGFGANIESWLLEEGEILCGKRFPHVIRFPNFYRRRFWTGLK